MNTKARDTIIYVIAGVVCLGMMVLFAIVGRSVYLDKTKDTRLLDNDTKTTATSTEEKDKVTEIKYVVDDTPLKEYVPEIERETEFADYVSDHDNKTVLTVDARKVTRPANVSADGKYITPVYEYNGVQYENSDEMYRAYLISRGITPQGWENVTPAEPLRDHGGKPIELR